MNTGATMTKNPQQFLPPWRDRGPDGKLGEPYGPSTALTFARQVARFGDWSYRKPPAKASRGADADALRAWMRLEDGTLRLGIPESEVRVYLLVYEGGKSVRWVARHLKLSRESCRSYIRRLRARMAG
jgi:DNA-directed RNA polymerase specialized sigma24 family protein